MEMHSTSVSECDIVHAILLCACEAWIFWAETCSDEAAVVGEAVVYAFVDGYV